MAEREQVLSGGAGAAAIVDPDPGRSGMLGSVDHHERKATLRQDVDPLVALGVALDDEPVDERVADQLVSGVRRGAWNDEHARTHLLAGQRYPLEEEHGGRVGERIGQRLVEDDADRARGSRAPAQSRARAPATLD